MRSAMQVFALLLTVQVWAQEAPSEATATPAPEPAPVAAVVAIPTTGAERIGQVGQIFRDKKRVVMAVDAYVADAEVPPTVIFTAASGEACEGRVLQAQLGKALVDFSACGKFDAIKAGSPLSRPLFAEVKEASPHANAEPGDGRAQPRFSIGLGYHTGSKITFSSVSANNGVNSGKGSASFDTEGSGQITVGAILSAEHSWGVYFGAIIEGKRELKTVTVNADGGTAFTGVYVGTKPTIQFTLFELSAIYRWSQIYIPFGINYSIPAYTQQEGTGETVETSGSMGAQVGIGYYASEKVRLELLSMVVATNVNATNGAATANYGKGTLPGMVFRMGYNF
ncbi:MAG: hypothetical protein KF799_06750 [Bdellovibrionales bacterium]|nr:hypothetical protein [Bdellovibrionales bacterium]